MLNLSHSMIYITIVIFCLAWKVNLYFIYFPLWTINITSRIFTENISWKQTNRTTKIQSKRCGYIPSLCLSGLSYTFTVLFSKDTHTYTIQALSAVMCDSVRHRCKGTGDPCRLIGRFSQPWFTASTLRSIPAVDLCLALPALAYLPGCLLQGSDRWVEAGNSGSPERIWIVDC